MFRVTDQQQLAPFIPPTTLLVYPETQTCEPSSSLCDEGQLNKDQHADVFVGNRRLDPTSRRLCFENLFMSAWGGAWYHVACMWDSPRTAPWKRTALMALAAAMALGLVYLWIARAVRGPESAPPVTPVGMKADEPKKLDARAVLALVAKHVVIPRYGMPRLATITDAEAAQKANILYKDGENGDKVLLWEDAVIVYSPVKDKVVAFFAPVLSPQQRPFIVPLGETGTSTPLSVEIRNGTQIRGEAARIRMLLKENVLFKVVRVGDAHPLPATVVVSSVDPARLQPLLQITSGTIGILPRGEVSSTADILLLLGA